MIRGTIDQWIDGETLVWVDCPYCGDENELTDDDVDGFLQRCIRYSVMDFDNPYTKNCCFCEQEFDVGGLEY